MHSRLGLSVALSVTFSVTLSLFVDRAFAQIATPTASCEQLSRSRYMVLVSNPIYTAIPQYLSIAAAPCTYLSQSVTSFGYFNSIDASAFRVNQLRQLGFDAIAQSFSPGTPIPNQIAGVSVIAEPSSINPMLSLQQVSAITGINAQSAAFNNRQVVLAAPLVSMNTANNLVSSLRSRGFSSDYVDPRAIQALNAFPPVVTPIPDPNPGNISGGKFKLLLPVVSNASLIQIRQEFPSATTRLYQRKRYAQVASYIDRFSASRERDRVLVRYPGSIVILD